MGKKVARFFPERLLKLIDGFIEPALLAQSGAEAVVRHVISARHRDRVAKQGFTVLPEPNLFPGQPHAGKHRRRGKNDCGSSPGNRAQDMAQPPNYNQQKAERGQVRIAVGHGLFSGLNEPDDRDERPKEPKPADKQPGDFAAPDERRHSGCQKQAQSGRDQALRPMRAVGVEHSEV